MNALRLIAALAGLCASATLWAYQLDPYFEAVGDSESIPDNNVSALAQDASGFLWIGTPDGLLRYDGYRFRPCGVALEGSTAGGDFVRALLWGSDGRLWVGSNADGVAVLNNDCLATARFSVDAVEGSRLSHDTVRALAEDNRGGIWIGTRDGLDRWDPTQGRIEAHRSRLGPDSSANDEHVMALLADSRGNLWVGSWGGLSVRPVGDSRFKRVLARSDDGQSLEGELVQSLIELDSGAVVAGSARVGAFLIAADGGSLTRIPRADGAEAASPAVLNLLQPRPGRLWIAVLGGIDVVDTGSWQLSHSIRPDPSMSSSLAHDQVRAMLLDRAGQIWIGGYGGGLQRHDPTNDAIAVLRHSPSRPASLSLPSVSSVLEIDPQQLWIGTRGNGVDVWDRERGLVGGFRPDAARPEALRNGIVSALARTALDSRWVGTQDGLYRYQASSGDFQLFDADDGLPNTYVRRLLSVNDDDLWIGTDGGLGYLAAGQERIVSIGDASGEPLREDINALSLAADGRLWIGSSAGLYTIAPRAQTLQPVSAMMAGQAMQMSVLGLLIDRAGSLWIDSPVGLHKATVGSIAEQGPLQLELEAISARLGRAGQPFGANLLDDDGGRIWSQSFVYDPSQDSLYELSRADGADLGTAWFRSYTRSSRGELLFGGSKGLMVVDPARFARWALVPPLVITEIKIDSKPVPIPASGEELLLQPGQRALNIEYSALDYTAPSRNRYAHKLEGFDREWIENDATRRVASYTQLSPGRYRLAIRGGGRTGVLSAAELGLPLRVLPAWWQSWWFRTLLVLLAILAVYALLQWQSQRMRRRSERLQQMVAERTAELSQAKEAAEQALEQLRGAQQELVSREKLASLGQLVAGVAHEINTPVGVALTASSYLGERCEALAQSFKSGQLQRSELVEFVDQTRAAARMIDENLGRASELVRNFKQVSVDRSRDDRRRFNLSECLHAVAGSLELTWKRRPIELRLDCDPNIEMDSFPGAIGQVVSNLIQNSLTHAFDDSRPGLMRLVGKAADHHRVKISFSDDGSGIAADALARIFEPFFTTRRAQGGSGLGLHIVYNLVSGQLGGRINARGEPGAGLRFELDLPLQGP